MARMIVVDRDGKEHDIQAKPGLKVMEILRELDYGVAAICGGLCSCATCHVYVDESWAGRLPRPQSDELELLKELPDFREATSRLSCQVDFTEALSGLKVAVARHSGFARMPAQRHFFSACRRTASCAAAMACGSPRNRRPSGCSCSFNS